MKIFNKKGMMDDLFDLFFTVFAAVFLLIFISAALTGGIKDNAKRSIGEIETFKKAEAAINNLRVHMQQGYNLEGANLDEKITQSRELGGKIITTCSDYLEQSNCDNDVVRLIPTHSQDQYECWWDLEKNRCLFRAKAK